jgi:hypothetical protein
LGTLIYSLLPAAISSAISQACNKAVSTIPLQTNYVHQAFFPQLPDSGEAYETQSPDKGQEINLVRDEEQKEEAE